MKRFASSLIAVLRCVSVAMLLQSGLAASTVVAQDYERIPWAQIYDYDSDTHLGDDVFGTVVADFENDASGRNSHGGPVCMQYANGDLVAFHTNTSGHNVDGWTEYARSRDDGKTWEMYNKFKYSYETYLENPKTTVWAEAGLVTERRDVQNYDRRKVERWARLRYRNWSNSRLCLVRISAGTARR